MSLNYNTLIDISLYNKNPDFSERPAGSSEPRWLNFVYHSLVSKNDLHKK
jgi:hypothetical protein